MYNRTNQKLLQSLTSESGAIVGIDLSHEMIHDGAAYAFVCEKSALESGNTCYISFLTNSAKTVHFRPALLYSTESLAIAKLYEGATVTGGTQVTVLNHNRKADDTSDVIVMSEPIVTDEGTRLPLTVFGGAYGSNQARSGGEGSAEEEYILKPDTQYLISIENLGSADTDIIIVPFWYEVEY